RQGSLVSLRRVVVAVRRVPAPDGPRRCDGTDRDRCERGRAESRDPASRLSPIAVALAAPDRDRRGEDVVEELVPAAVLVRDRPQEVPAFGGAETLEQRHDLCGRPTSPLCEVDAALRDPRAGAGDEEPEAGGGGSPLAFREASERGGHVLLDDARAS